MVYAVIVDPLSTGKEYGPAFREAGAIPIAVLSGLRPPEPYVASWFPENYDAVHYYDGDFGALAASLRAYHEMFVIPGSESGVELADRLIDALVPGTGNVSELTAARRDKREMSAALERAGIPRLREICTSSAQAVAAWLDKENLTGGRLVVKPPKSAGGDEVHVVPEGQDWRPRFDDILGRTNKMDIVNDAVIVQEYAQGTEYLIDTYSVDGHHSMVDACYYTKIQRGDKIGIYQRIDFVGPADDALAVIWPYVLRVLEAVGIRNGCGHVEVMLTPDGPRLVEIGARPAGGGHQLISELATGDNHIRRTVAHRMRGEFKPGFALVQQVRGVFVSAVRSGILRNGDLMHKAEGLPSFHWLAILRDNDSTVPETVDLFTCLAWVILVHRDPAVLDDDFQRVLELEAQIVIDPQ